MATTAGSLSAVSVGSSTDSLLSAAASGGTAPYTYQWYRSTATGFTPGSANLITGATSLTLNDTGLTPGTTYYYKVVATDSGAVTGTSSQLTVTTTAAVPSLNAITQAPFLGMLDQYYNGNTLPVQFDPASSGTLSAGMAVKFTTAPTGGVPTVAPCTAASDVPAGFVNFNMKDTSYSPGDMLEISADHNVMYLYASLAVNRGNKLTSLPAGVAGGCNGGVVPATGSSGFPIVGIALDTGAIGSLIRVFLQPLAGAID